MRHAVSGRLVVAWGTAASADEQLARLAETFIGAPTSGARIVRACRSCGSDRHGKPYVVGLDEPIHVNLSKSGEIALLAVSDAGPVGIDVEALQPGGTLDVATWGRKASGGIAALAVSDAGPVGIDVEALTISAPSPGLTTWVRKESVVKATGHGLTIDPDLIEVTPPDLAPALVAWPQAEPLDSPVWMYDIECPAGYVAAAAVLSNVPPELLTSRAAPEG